MLTLEYVKAALEGEDQFAFLRDVTIGTVPELGSKFDAWLRNVKDAGVMQQAMDNDKLISSILHSALSANKDGLSMDAGWRAGYFNGVMRSQRFTNLVEALRDSVRPGSLIRETAPLVGEWFNDFTAGESVLAKTAGKLNWGLGRVLAPAALAGGLLGLAEERQDWSHLSTEDRVVDTLANGGNAIAGGAGTALLLGASLGPGVLVFAGAAGLVALGATAYKYRKQIAGAVGDATKFVGSVDSAIAHGAADAVHETGKLADAAAARAGNAIDDVAHSYGNEAKAVGNTAGAVLDHVDPRLGTAAREAGAAASTAIDTAGDAADHAAHAIGDGVSHAADAVSHGLDHASDSISHDAKKVGNFIGGIFG